jgi:hypothetical protein
MADELKWHFGATVRTVSTISGDCTCIARRMLPAEVFSDMAHPRRITAPSGDQRRNDDDNGSCVSPSFVPIRNMLINLNGGTRAYK